MFAYLFIGALIANNHPFVLVTFIKSAGLASLRQKSNIAKVGMINDIHIVIQAWQGFEGVLTKNNFVQVGKK
ncbi:hypothetical protein [Yersinia massiliensis]|uniref:hypothetical protein n=1 Tax=Yersinia massiliensis TaxID=419257 RepID=UPI001CFDB56C|nr:hypothetical protein [Yersinia massiliensis]MCB5308321.1 hypothetical protein [Yersinia massiliensis]